MSAPSSCTTACILAPVAPSCSLLPAGPTDILVLCYHAVSEGWPAVTAVTAEEIRRQVGTLVARGYVGMTFTDALTAPAAPRVLAVTFDDAHRSVLHAAAPILDELGVPGTVFAPTDWIGTGRPTSWAGFERWVGTEHEHELVCLDWDELRGLVDRGWEVGSHTMSHPRLTRLGDQALSVELRGSRERLETELGRPCSSIAYPYSDVDRRVVRHARAAGYALAATMPIRHHYALPLQWPRVGVSRGESRLRFGVLTARATRHAQLGPGIGPAIERARELRRRLRDGRRAA
jgi:peptidoglycan/xylan/chitin deacetylase (PgdA/CDA1 family)